MAPKTITCPACGQQATVEKASTLYLLGIDPQAAAKAAQAAAKDSPAPQPAVLEQLSAGEQRALARRLAPPSSPQQALTRPVHPDLVVVAFSLVLPVFLYGILTSQPEALAVVAPVLLLFYGLYFWRRKSILQRFNAGLQQRKAEDERVRRAIQRWMRLYYCLDDDAVFLPGDTQVTPADQMLGKLLG